MSRGRQNLLGMASALQEKPAAEKAAIDPRFEGLVLDFLSYLELERGLSRNTLNAYRTDLLQFGEFLAAHEIDALTIAAGRHRRLPRRARHRQRRGPPCSAATIHRKSACLRSFYKHLRRDELIADDPTAALSAPRRAKKLPQVLNYAEVQKLLASPRGDEPTTLRDRALLEVMYACGLRASETIGLELADIDLHEGFLRARGKGSKERLVPLGRQAIAAITGYLRGGRPKLVGDRHEAKLFLNFRGGPLTRQGLYKIVQRHARDAGLAGQMSPHTLRHSFATHLLAGRLRPARRAGDARPRRHRDDPDVHAPLRRAAEGGLLPLPPARQRLTRSRLGSLSAPKVDRGR